MDQNVQKKLFLSQLQAVWFNLWKEEAYQRKYPFVYWDKYHKMEAVDVEKNCQKIQYKGLELQINCKSAKKRSLHEVIMTGTAFDLWFYYIKLLHDISSHHFNNCWQMFQFMLCQSNLQENQILLIQEFARNFVIDFQD